MFTNNFSSGINSNFGSAGSINDSFGFNRFNINAGGNIFNHNGLNTGLNFNNGLLTNVWGGPIGHTDSFGRLRDNLGRDMGFGIR